jgi:UDP-N-acetylmuramate-alanine ligase
VIVAEVYRAREPPPRVGEVTAADLADKTRAGGVEVFPVYATGPILDVLESGLRAGDVVVTMGAGDIRKVCDGLFERAGKDRAAR